MSINGGIFSYFDVSRQGFPLDPMGEDELVLLRAIRDGAYMRNGKLTDEFYSIVSKHEKEYEEAERISKLPDNPDMDRVEKFVEKINRKIVL